MKNSSTFAIGVMSGTSLDGVDLCYVKFTRDVQYSFEIVAASTIPYPVSWKEKLVAAFSKAPDELTKLNEEYGTYLGDLVVNFIQQNKIEAVDLIASHGHTIFHKPAENFTLQIGDGSRIANRTGITVVADFRTQDVHLGGQGAPLVPIGDRLLFWHYDYCLNLGGFANISYEQGSKRIAFDICPINIVLNHYTQQRGLPYDDGGQLAAKGSISKALLADLNGLDFYVKEPPKSLGFEWVAEIVIPLIDRHNLVFEDVLATFVEHVAYQIAQVIQANKSVLVTGGGAYNTYFIERLIALSKAKIYIPEKEIIEYKEALIFALLGSLRLRDEVNVLKEVTGASRDHSAGRISNV